MSRVRSRCTITRTAGGLGTPGFSECGTCVAAIAPRRCTAVEVTEDDEPYNTRTEAARDREGGTTMVL